jgi:Subunit CCDC53 of WASH complex
MSVCVAVFVSVVMAFVCVGVSRCWQRVPPAQRGIVSFDQSSLPNKRGEFEFCYVEGLTKAVIGRGGPFTIDIGPKREVIARVTAPEPSRAYLPSAPPAVESSVPEKVVVGEPVPVQGGKHVGVCSVPLGLPVDVPEPVNAIVTPTKPPAPVFVSQPVVDVPKPPVVAVEVVVPVPVVAPIAAVPDVPKPPAVVLETHVPAPAPTSVVAPAPAPAPDAVSAEQPQAAASSTGDVPAKYLQMKKMNLPDHVIRQRMTLDGMDASVIDAFVGPGEPQVAAAPRPTPPKPPAPPKPPVAPVATSNPAPTKPAPTPVVPAANPAAASAPKPVTSLPPLSKDKDLDLNMCLSQFRTLRPPSRFAEAMQQCDAAAMNGEDGLDLLEPRVPLGEDARPFLVRHQLCLVCLPSTLNRFLVLSFVCRRSLVTCPRSHRHSCSC